VQNQGLNEAQRQAVETLHGPLLIVAGAGAGKTKTLTHRMGNLILHGVDPENILAITFTNKAAREMRERMAVLLEQIRGSSDAIHTTPFIGTFHALGVLIMRENAEVMRTPRHFSIFDRNDATRLIKQAVRDAGLDPKYVEPSKLLSTISRHKGNATTLQQFKIEAQGSYRGELLADIWTRYETMLSAHQALDFDDLLVRPLMLLSSRDDICRVYRLRWQYLHIDEYQDTNKVQYELTRRLIGSEQNICVVGDSDQSIYGWRGADVRNILDFEKDYPQARVILLEENYRSTQRILLAANTIIAKNRLRKEKNLYTKNGEGDLLTLYAGYDEVDEARHIAESVRALVATGVRPQEIAILYRANFQSRALEAAFLEARVPYQVLGVRFFERKEVKDLLSYIRAALNPESRADIERVVNFPPRGIGSVTVKKLFTSGREALSGTTRRKIDDFYAMIADLREILTTQLASKAIRATIERTGLFDFLKQGDEEAHERLENLEELVTLALSYDNTPAPEGIEALLTDAALASDQDSLIKNREAVKLMTVHAAKGLEFDTVFITGLEDGLFPYTRESETEHEREEERRLMYVALTRARKKVFLSYASVRTIFGSRQIHMPSEYLMDIDEELIEQIMSASQPRKVIVF
jgi:DNA helicase-2/ATP-dependent DNA helicase PcrA